jgi:hypothetical protein
VQADAGIVERVEEARVGAGEDGDSGLLQQREQPRRYGEAEDRIGRAASDIVGYFDGVSSPRAR